MNLQKEYDKIRFWFKATITSVQYDDLDWDGEVLYVLLKNKTIETYTRNDLVNIGILE
ncbi:MAG: hypothetical protein FWG98_00570 [Candidatus Cloacimonetes bacterium]|nr:hypothetical protein [Candidatus Cloacimonadota bacterium]